MTDTERNWWPEGYDLPAFRVKRQSYGLENGGDWVRGSSVVTLPHTALRYPTVFVGNTEVTTNKAIIYARPFDYHTVEVIWGWPTSNPDWEEVALVRSAMGHPSTPQDGVTVFRADREEFDSVNGMMPAPIVYDQPLPSGWWYYYSLFFRINPTTWVLGMSDGCVLPRDYNHRTHMWDVVPPYYQMIDDQYRNNAGFLRQFLTVFGFAMDNTREFVEGVLNLHRLDKTPMQLLKGLGANYDMPYEAGIGDIRYRGMVANSQTSQHTRGTSKGLKNLVEAVSKYQTSVTGSETVMLTPDDSDFFRSTGNWGGLHPDAVGPTLAADDTLTPPLAWDRVFLDRVNKPAHVGRGVIRVYTDKVDEEADLIFDCGNARIRVDDNPLLDPDEDTIPELWVPGPDGGAAGFSRDARPKETGISIIAGVPYGFSVWVQAPELDFTVVPFMLWIGPSGEHKEVLEVSAANPLGTTGTTWRQFTAQGYAPERTETTPEARYLIPGLYIFDRDVHTLTYRSAAIDICGAMVYQLGDEDETVSVTPPDRYITLGDPTEKLGATKEGYEGFILGSPRGSQ